MSELVNLQAIRTKNPIIVLIFLSCCIVLCFLPTGFEHSRAKDSYLVKARVVSVDNADLRQNLIVYTGTQDIQVELLEGPHKGEKARVLNPLSGKLEFDEIYQTGDTILVEYKLDEGRIHMAFTRGYYRLTYELILIAVFCIFIIAVAGFTGFKALISFVFAALMVATAPIDRANSSFSSLISMATTFAPNALAIMIADRPTPPQP